MDERSDDEDVRKLIRAELRGKNILIVIGLWAAIVGGVLFAIYALCRYGLADDNSSVYLKVFCGAYLMGVAFFFVFRKQMLSDYPLSVAIVGGLSLPAPFGMFMLGVFLFGNAMLDTQAPQPVDYFVMGKLPRETTLRIVSVAANDKLYTVSRPDYERAHVGSVIVLDTGPGYFGQPWIKGYTLKN